MRCQRAFLVLLRFNRLVKSLVNCRMSVARNKNALATFDECRDKVGNSVSFPRARRPSDVCKCGTAGLFDDPAGLATEIYESGRGLQGSKSHRGFDWVKRRHCQGANKCRLFGCLIQNLRKLTEQRRVVDDEDCSMNPWWVRRRAVNAKINAISLLTDHRHCIFFVCGLESSSCLFWNSRAVRYDESEDGLGLAPILDEFSRENFVIL